MMNANSHFVRLKYSLIIYTVFFTYVTHYLNNKLKLVLTIYIPEQVKGYGSLIKVGTKVQGRTGH